ncbi:amino acid adenylation domain-containing protein [Phenylobacterium sp.]|uniref:non-ribosomal peptide synthetase n=1 Tax=Phenylobacterium sp. TaxID=1871053 RepID=UPI0025F3AC37|nr:amino acid adenylation domain-containing protein [Phenylobacterium sp.]MCA6289916.1 amino acid adenylation domain-containing protein [Phenylobacterium sp.]MCA6346652.1 amino acid adenylation domain-containing protein [Phenylobacterium sp.]MCA6349248.1 amino acid adenylation domain-containing protein [Phenylobacterium sp.]MCA6352210.1 amino acid adenylation domain-containing protein [Phenylobacterium sp.]MCA6355635.1 amino acid adenylation domain-containing protein [Phenylobacterium sp.]
MQGEAIVRATLTTGQRAVWFLDATLRLRSLFNIAVRVGLRGPCETGRLADRLETAFAREGLSGQAIAPGVEPRLIQGPARLQIDHQDLRERGRTGALRAARRLARRLAAAPFDLEAAPVLRLSLCKVSNDELWLVAVTHPAVCDRSELLLRLTQALDGEMESEAALEPDHAGPARDWRQALDGRPTVSSFPPERRRSSRPTGPASESRLTLARGDRRRLADLAAAAAAPLEAVVVAGVWLVLQRYSGLDAPLLGVSGPEPETTGSMSRESVGVIRLELGPEATSRDAVVAAAGELKAARSAVGAAFRDALADAAASALDRAIGAAQVHCRFWRTPPRTRAGQALSWQPVTAGALAHDLTLHVLDDGAQLTLQAEHRTDLIGRPYATRILHSVRTLLMALADAPDQRATELDLLDADERRRLTSVLNATDAPLPDRSLLDLFVAAAAAAPASGAARCVDADLTYAELLDRAGALASRLRADHGVGRGDIVGVCLPRDSRVVTALTAVALSGAAYLPLDPALPVARRRFMALDSEAKLVLTCEPFADDIAGPKVLLAPGAVAGGTALSSLRPPINLADPFYVIYTSGSTGEPNGVVLNHGGRANNFLDLVRRFGIGAGDRVFGVSSIGFDMSAFDVFGTLAAGAELILVDTQGQPSPRRWASHLLASQATVWHSAPALLTLVLEQLEARGTRLPALRLALLGGDWIPLDMADRLRALAPEVRIVSLGGATECSMDSTIYEIGQIDPDWSSIPYGRAMANQTAYVLDARMRPQPINVAGDLFLGGVGVGDGYLNRPDLTRDRFVQDPFGGPDARLFRTGDIARWRASGQLELLGRSDFQVKINGQRVELGEIESVLRRGPGIEDAAVRYIAGFGANGLVGYVTPRLDDKALERVRDILREHLAPHMTPGVLTSLDALPLSPNGKVDRKALPPPQAQAPAYAVATPQDAVQQGVRAVFADILGVAGIDPQADLLELGMDSFGMLRALGQLPRTVDAADLVRRPTLQALSAAVREAGGDPLLFDYREGPQARGPVLAYVPSRPEAAVRLGAFAASLETAQIWAAPGPDGGLQGWATRIAERLCAASGSVADYLVCAAPPHTAAADALVAALATRNCRALHVSVPPGAHDDAALGTLADGLRSHLTMRAVRASEIVR